MQAGIQIRHTVVARAVADTLLLESRIANLGELPFAVMRLCYPFITEPHALANNPKVGPACYGTSTAIAPGDSLRIATDGIMFGQPGHYRFRVHAIDPAETDAFIELDVVAARPKSPHGA